MAFDGDTKMGVLFDNPQTMEILKKHLPQIKTAGPMINMARGMTLKAVAKFPQAGISAEKLQTIVAELEDFSRNHQSG